MATVFKALKSISVFFDWIIYEIMTYAYVLFTAMCRLDPQNLSTVFQSITERIKVFFGIVMLFIIAFNLLQFLVDPGKVESGSTKLVQKIVISIVLLVSSQFIFLLLGQLEQGIVGEKLIEQIIMGEDAKKSSEKSNDPVANSQLYEDYRSTGKWFSYNMLFSFISIDESVKKDIMSGEQGLDSIKNHINDANTEYEFPIISGLCGIFVIVMFVTFAMDIGLRAFNLLILQVISPIPIMAYVAPGGEGILNKYVKTYISTYVQLFVKLFTVYLTLYLMVYCMSTILDIAEVGVEGGLTGQFQEYNIFGSVIPDGTPAFLRITMVAIIFVALFKFAQALPSLLGDIFGIKFDDMGGMFKTTGAIVAGGLGLGLGTVGGLAAGIRGRAGVLGTLGAMGKGAFGGASNGARSKNIKDFFANQKTNKEGLNKYASDIGAAGGVGRSFVNKAAASIDSTAAFFRGDQRKLGDVAVAKAANQKAIEKNSERAGVHQKLRDYENKVRSAGLEGWLKEHSYDSKEDAIRRMTASEESDLEVAKSTGDAASISAAYSAYQSALTTAKSNIETGAKGYISDPTKLASDRELADAFAEMNAYISNNPGEFYGAPTISDATTLGSVMSGSKASIGSISAQRRTLESQKTSLDAREKQIKASKTAEMAKKAKTSAEDEAVRRGYSGKEDK